MSYIERDIQRLTAVLANRRLIEQSGTQEHEMYIDFEDLNFTLYTGEGVCGLLSKDSKVVLGITPPSVFPVYTGDGSNADVQYFEHYDEGLNMYDTSAYGQARWEFLEQVLNDLVVHGANSVQNLLNGGVNDEL